MKAKIIARDIYGNLHKVETFEKLAKIIKYPQHIDICNSKWERIEKKYFDFEIFGAKVINISFC